MSRKTELPSLRNFGLTFTAVCAILGLLPWMLRAAAPNKLLLTAAVVLLAITFLVPRILMPFNLVWFQFSLLLHRVVNPVLMLLAYYGAFLPTGLVLKLTGSDLLRLKWRPEAQTYWIKREKSESNPSSMSRQF